MTIEERTVPREAYYRILGDNIRRHREAHGWSQLRLATELEFTSNVAVSMWESGKRSPDAWTVDRLEALFSARLRP